MRRLTAVLVVALIALAPFVWIETAWARAGGGTSGGSRGSRSYSPPASSSQGMSRQPTAPAPPPPMTQPAPSRPGWGGMLGGALGGLLLGGLIGSLLSGGAYGGGGIGFLEIILLAGLAYLAFRALRSRSPQPAAPSGYASPGGYGGVEDRQASYSPASATVESAPSADDLDRGVGYIRQMDPAFDARRFSETAQDVFFKVQAAWAARDMGRASTVLTPEMQALLQKDCDRLRAERRINRLENVAVRQAEVTEAWQERGQDYVTLHFLASLLDYTTDEQSGQIVDGSATDPVKFEEYWTFVRPIGPNPWRLSAIQQPGG